MSSRYPRSVGRLLVIGASVNPSGCIHTATKEVAAIVVAGDSGERIQHTAVGPIVSDFLIYTPAKWPLSDFFLRLKSGELVEAFQRIDLSYTPAKSDNKAIQELLDAGLVPVYVALSNRTTSPINVSLNAVSLENGSTRFHVIPIDDLPREFSHLYPAAIGANVANTVLVFAGVVAVIALSCSNNSGSCGSLFRDAFEFLRNPSSKETSVYNPVMKTTAIDYRDFLFAGGQIGPGAIRSGLVFFRVPAIVERDKLTLVLELEKIPASNVKLPD